MHRPLLRALPGIALALALFGGSSALYASSLLSPTDLASRGCILSDLNDIAGCQKGDQLIYLPPKFGNEQIPVLAAAFCDLRLSVVWTNGGLTCIYAGQRYTVKARDEIEAKKYRALYNEVKANPDGWLKTEDDEFWRVETQGTGIDIAAGVTVRVERAECEHDLQGEEVSRTDFEGVAEQKIMEKSIIEQLHAKEGATIEIVSPTKHSFLRCIVKKAATKN